MNRPPSLLHLLIAITWLATPAMGHAVDDVPLRLADGGHNQITVSALGDGAWELHTTGGDPYVVTVPAAAPYDLAATPILGFEYLCVTGLDSLEVFAGPGWSAQRRVGVPGLDARQGWSPFAIDLGASAAISTAKPTRWRIDLGRQPDRVLQIRHLRLRARDPDESRVAAGLERRRELALAADQALRDYLARDFPAKVTRIAVDGDTITITGRSASADGGVALLAEWPAWQPVAATMRFATTWPLPGQDFSVSVPRSASDGGDRMLSRFAVIRRTGTDDTLLSHGRWADELPVASGLPAGIQRSKKGLGGFHNDPRCIADLDALGIGSVTVNIPLSGLFQDGPGDGATAIAAGGRTWHLRAKAFDGLDATMLAAARRGVVVLGIILVPPARSWPAKELGALLQHPGYDPAGIYTMPNLTTAQSTAAYVMVLDLLASRYTRTDGRYGRIHHFIMHNEMDMGWEWTNSGRNPGLLYLDQYYRSMRLADLVLRRQDRHAQTLISLTHFWARTDDPSIHHAPREMLDQLLQLSRVEGDFPWGLAYHPYPSSLVEPKFWLDRDALFALDTPLITFRNLEVLDAWAHQPGTLYQGRTMRRIHLSEQGPNSRDYGATALAEQAASMAYAWKKLARLDAIVGFEYHNWVDNRHEGGLRIGLRRFPDDAQEPFGPKPVWHVYKALDTSDEDRACAFALPIIGITDWSQAIHQGVIPVHTGTVTPGRTTP